ncbi:MAG TPA: class II aldolase/adducin family protein [Thermoanaerobaculia bacterium]
MIDEVRSEVWRHAVAMGERGLVVGSAGNVSARIDGERIAITPTSIPYDEMSADQIVIIPDEDRARASFELPTHLEIYRARPDVGAIVHTHSPHVTALSLLRKPLPPMIDEMMIYLGGTIEVAEYAFSGSEDLGRNAVRALGDRAAVILSNHGDVCVGRTLTEALHIAMVMESSARVVLEALRSGQPVALPPEAVEKGRRMYEARIRIR